MSTLHVLVFCLLAVTCMSMTLKGQKLSRSNMTQTLPGGGQGLENKPGEHTVGDRKMKAGDDGKMRITNTKSNKAVDFGVSKIEELDSNKNKVCGSDGEFDFDGNNPNPKKPSGETIRRYSDTSKELTGATVDVATSIKGGKQNNNIKQTGTMQGDGQTNVFKVGDFKVEQEYLTKSNDEETTVKVGNSETKLSKGDMKFTLKLSGYKPCGPGGRTCNCPGGASPSNGAFLKVYFQVQGDSGARKDTKPERKTGTAKSSSSTSSEEEFSICGDTCSDGMRMKMMTEAAVDNMTDVSTAAVEVASATWAITNGTATGFTIIIPLQDKSPNTTYTYDPTLTEYSSAATVLASAVLVALVSLRQFL